MREFVVVDGVKLSSGQVERAYKGLHAAPPPREFKRGEIVRMTDRQGPLYVVIGPAASSSNRCRKYELMELQTSRIGQQAWISTPQWWEVVSVTAVTLKEEQTHGTG